MNWELFAAFLLMTVILLLTPGPIVTLVVATGATHGMRAALTTVAGTTLGNAALLAVIACGLGVVLEHAAVVFEVLRWVGAAYLIWLGIQSWRHAGEQPAAVIPAGHVHFRRGLAVALANPKAIVFFTAFLPQFIDPALPFGRQLAVLCVAFIAMVGVIESAWAVAAGLARVRFMPRASARVLGRISGAVLIAGGLWLTLARRPV